MSKAHARIIAIVALLLGAVAVWRLFQTPAPDIVRFVVYEGVAVVLAGAMLYSLLFGAETSWLKRVAVGWALGYVVETWAFDIASALGLRSLFRFYPLFGIALFVVWLIRNRAKVRWASFSPLNVWHAISFVALLLAAITLVAFAYFPETPLPSTITTADYYPDLVFHLSSAAELKNHFPIGDPRVLGETVHYYFFANSHLAAVSTATGIELSTLLFRLYLLPLIALMCLQVYVLARELVGSHWAGLIAIVLVMFVGEFDTVPQTGDVWPTSDGYTQHFNLFFLFLRLSPSLAMGNVLFLASAIVVKDFLGPSSREPAHAPVPRVATIGALVLATTNAKFFSSAVLAGGLACFAVWNVWLERRIDARAVLIMLLVLAIGSFRFLTDFRFNDSVTLALAPLQVGKWMPGMSSWAALVDALPPLAQAVALVPLNIVAFTAQMPMHMIGNAALLVITRFRPARQLAFVTSLFVVGTASLMVVWFNGAYGLLHAGYVAGAVSGACGLWMLLVAARRWARWKQVAVFAPLAVMLALGLLDIPLDNLEKWQRLATGKRTFVESNLLTRGIYLGMLWLREHTSVDDVIAVNNQFRAQGDPRYLYFSALSERRVFLEGWVYLHERNWYQGAPGFAYRDQLNLNRQVFQNADSDAAQELMRRGVSYLVVDKLHGSVNPDLAKIAEQEFSNSDIAIFKLSQNQR